MSTFNAGGVVVGVAPRTASKVLLELSSVELASAVKHWVPSVVVDVARFVTVVLK